MKSSLGRSIRVPKLDDIRPPLPPRSPLQRDVDGDRLPALQRHPQVLRMTIRQYLWLGQWKHCQEEWTVVIIPKDLQTRRFKGNAERLADPCSWVHLPMSFAICTDPERLCPEHFPSVLLACQRLPQEGHRRSAERWRAKALARGQIVVLCVVRVMHRVILRHVIPLRVP